MSATFFLFCQTMPDFISFTCLVLMSFCSGQSKVCSFEYLFLCFSVSLFLCFSVSLFLCFSAFLFLCFSVFLFFYSIVFLEIIHKKIKALEMAVCILNFFFFSSYRFLVWLIYFLPLLFPDCVHCLLRLVLMLLPNPFED